MTRVYCVLDTRLVSGGLTEFEWDDKANHCAEEVPQGANNGKFAGKDRCGTDCLSCWPVRSSLVLGFA